MIFPCSHLQVAASGCKWLLEASGCKWLLKWLQVAAGSKWLQVVDFWKIKIRCSCVLNGILILLSVLCCEKWIRNNAFAQTGLVVGVGHK